MPALNFQARFADAVEMGTKTQTIRRVAKRPIVDGDILYLYTGMRTKACRKLREVTCLSVTPILLAAEGIWLDGHKTTKDLADAIAINDGFTAYPDMREWFRKQYGSRMFTGVLINWSAR